MVRPNGRVAVMIEIPREHAQWQSVRLSSGMMGGTIYEDWDSALMELEERAKY